MCILHRAAVGLYHPKGYTDKDRDLGLLIYRVSEISKLLLNLI
jgi:hypothetical protein